MLADGELLFTGTPCELEQATGGEDRARHFEAAFVAFLRERGHAFHVKPEGGQA